MNFPFKIVMASSPPAMRTVSDVAICHAGVEYALSTGPCTFTPEDLRDAVMAANEDPSIPSPRLKLGHIDPRFNGPEFDASPAFGKATNLRLSENGMTVYADYVGVPGWLADILPTAYPSRSIEGYWNVESQHGKKWRFVLSACSLLGVTWPGVTVLEDLPQYYGNEIPEGVIFEPIAATGGDPLTTNASANLDDVRRAFYNDYVKAGEENFWWWIQAVLTDPNQLVVEDDESGQLYMIPFSSDANGVVSFGDADAVRIDYIPDNREALKAAASHVAATLACGRKVTASWPTRAASRPDNPGGAMDPKEVRKQLSLPEDATDEQVHTALLEKSGLVTPETPAAPALAVVETPVVETPVTPVEPPAVQLTPEQIAASREVQLPPGTLLVDEDAWKNVQAGVAAAADLVKKDAARERNDLVRAAVGDGRIPPARAEHWFNYLGEDLEGGKAALAAMAPNLVPVEERGHARPADEGGQPDLEQDVVSGWSDQLFPEVRDMHARDALVAAGTATPRSRVQKDLPYARR